MILGSRKDAKTQRNEEILCAFAPLREFLIFKFKNAKFYTKMNQLTRILRFYLFWLGNALFIQGVISLIFGVTNREPLIFIGRRLTSDPLHATIHIVWGLVIFLLLKQRIRQGLLGVIGLVFGVFYLLLGVMGIVIFHPLGMQLGWGENLFHLLAGSIALLLGMWQRWQRIACGKADEADG
jgi:hypothetical protein